MITLTVNAATVPVCLPSAEQRKVFDRLFADGGVSELTDPGEVWAAYAAEWPCPQKPRWVEPKLGRLHWPMIGASRYAHAVYCLHEADWLAVSADAAAGQPVTVAFEDGADPDETARTIELNFLCARPLVRLNAGEAPVAEDQPGDAWFVVLVDDRYFDAKTAIVGAGTPADEEGAGSGAAGGNGGSVPVFRTWSELFAGFSISVADAVSTNYGMPDPSRWSEPRMRGRSIAVLADIAAALVGSRIVSVPGASLSLQRPTTARATALDSAYGAAQAANRVTWGGPIEADDATGETPPTVRGVFLAPSDSRVETLDSASTGYTGWPTNRPMSAALDPAVHETAVVKQAALDQWADDFCAWRFGMFSTTLAGVSLPAASGFCWAFTIDSDRDTLRTRWERPPALLGWLARAQSTAKNTDQPNYPTTTGTTSCTIPAGGGSGAATGLAWYTRYLHLAGVEVAAGQTLAPGQRLGVLMASPTGGFAHLHHALTDGGEPFLWPETDFPVAGVALDIDDWLGLPTVGARTGQLPPRASRFDADQLAEIESRYRFPLDTNPRWVQFLGSTFHRLYDYYAVDIAFLDTTDPNEVAGAPVYAAVGGSDVLTEVMWTGYRGQAGWGVLLRHRLCGAHDDGDSGEDMGATPPGGQFGGGGDFDGDPHTVNRGGLLDLVSRVCIGPITAGTLIGRAAEDGDGPMQEIGVGEGLRLIDAVLSADAPDLFVADDAASTPVTIRGFAGQLAPLLRLESADGTLLSQFDENGVFRGPADFGEWS